MFNDLMVKIDKEISLSSRIGGKGKSKKKMPMITRLEPVREEEEARIPERLSRQAYNPTWLVSMSDTVQATLNMRDFDLVNPDGTLIKG